MDRLSQSTAEERAALLAAGMTELTRAEFLARIVRLGYRLRQHCCLSYVNRGNARPYRARSLSYTDIETGLSFAHCQGRRDSRFQQLQTMRRDCFVFSNGRIYEL